MNEVIKLLTDNETTNIKIAIALSVLFIVFLYRIVYMRLDKIDFNPDHFRNKKKILELKEYQKLSKDYKGNFKNDFIDNRLKELYFEINTGITTNYQSINNYITLHNQLGKEFTWDIIKSAKPYLVLKGNSLKVKIPKNDYKRYNITKKAILINLFIFAALFIFSLFVYDKLGLRFQLLLLYIIALTIASLLILVFSHSSMKSALEIQKRLDKLKQTKKRRKKRNKKEEF